jgi:hypothetical protein
MNPFMLLISFSPWIVFGIIAGHTLASLEIALGISLILTVLISYKDLKKKMIVSWVTLIYFLITCFLVIVLHQYAIIPFIGIASSAVLTLIAFGTIAAGLPFTMQYARQEVPQERWNDPIFVKINRELTAGWGLLFLVGLINSLIQYAYPDFLGLLGDAMMYITIVVGMVFTMKYPAYAKQKAANAQKTQ